MHRRSRPPHTLAATVLVLLALLTSGCYQVVQCDGGYCGVQYERPQGVAQRPAKDVESVALLRADQPLPDGAQVVGTFTWSVTLLDAAVSGWAKCSDEVEDFFRNKAANLGYDGVAGVQLVVAGGASEANLTMLDANGGLYLSNISLSGSLGSRDTNWQTGAVPIAMFMTAPPFGSCVGVPYIIE